MAEAEYAETYLNEGLGQKQDEHEYEEPEQPYVTIDHVQPAVAPLPPGNPPLQIDSEEKKTTRMEWLIPAFVATTVIFAGMFVVVFVMMATSSSGDVGLPTPNNQIRYKLEYLEKNINATLAENNRLGSRTDEMVNTTNAQIQEMNKIIRKNNLEIEQMRTELANKSEAITSLEGRVVGIGVGWSRASNNRLYKHFTHENANYETAKSRCEVFGAKLASAGLRTAELRSEIKRLLPSLVQRNSYTWIGLDNLVSQGNYVWADGVASNSSNTDWYPGQPDLSSQRCVYMHGPHNGRLFGYPCTYSRNYVCEF